MMVLTVLTVLSTALALFGASLLAAERAGVITHDDTE